VTRWNRKAREGKEDGRWERRKEKEEETIALFLDERRVDCSYLPIFKGKATHISIIVTGITGSFI